MATQQDQIKKCNNKSYLIKDRNDEKWKIYSETAKTKQNFVKINMYLHIRQRAAWSRNAWFIPPIHQKESLKKDSPWSCEEGWWASASMPVSFPSVALGRSNLWTSSSLLLCWQLKRENSFDTFSRQTMSRKKLTNNSIVVVVLHSHRNVFNAEIHFDSFYAQISSVIVFLLIGNPLEIDFTSHTFIVTPIISSSRRLN